LTLTSTDAAFNGEPLVLTLSQCIDDEGDGLIDSFTVEAEHGTVSLPSVSGQFTGGKPANPDADPTTIVDVNGSPTLDEWNKYAIGMNVVEYDEDGDFGYWRLTSASTYEAHYQAQDRTGRSTPLNGTYTYEKTGPSTGTFTVSDAVWGAGRVVRLEFRDFFNGTWETDAATDNLLFFYTLKGEWRTISDISLIE